jgi:transcription initiation factor TFIID subunit 3
MSSDFFFSLIRISCAQIFRAAGIDRCSPSLLDAATDILVRYLCQLANQASKYAALSGRPEVVIQDVALAMEEMGLIRPRAILDPYDTDPNSLAGFTSFVEWAKGPIPEEARRISRIPQSQAPPVQQASAPQKRESNAASIANVATTVSIGVITTKPSEDEEWLTTLMRKKIKVGHETRFKGTVLGQHEEVESETKIVGGPPHLDEKVAVDTS